MKLNALFVLIVLGSPPGKAVSSTGKVPETPAAHRKQAIPLDGRDSGERDRRPLRDHLITYGAMWAFTFTVNYGGLGSKFRTQASFKRVGRNLISAPEMDDGDMWVTNYLAHPLFGAVTYNRFRGLGYSARHSFAASAVHSALFEYTIEGFVQPPSGVDLLVTPLLGAPAGAMLGKWTLPVSVPYLIMKYVFRFPR